MEEILREGLGRLGVPADEAILSKLCRFGRELEQANTVTNLTAITEPEQIARLHFLDSAALLPMADFPGARVLDVGCGAGFPGFVLKLLQPDIRLTLLDSAGKKIDFCLAERRSLQLENVECLWGRAEQQPQLRESFDIVVSRAVAELKVLAELCMPMVAVGGKFLAMKGPDCDQEAKDAEFAFKTLGGSLSEIRRYTIPGTDICHAVVCVEKIKHTPPQYPRRYSQFKRRPLQV